MKFRVVTNLIRGVECVEVFDDDGGLLATINSHQRGLHVVSKHLRGTEQPSGVVREIVPSVLVLIERRH